MRMRALDVVVTDIFCCWMFGDCRALVFRGLISGGRKGLGRGEEVRFLLEWEEDDDDGGSLLGPCSDWTAAVVLACDLRPTYACFAVPRGTIFPPRRMVGAHRMGGQPRGCESDGVDMRLWRRRMGLTATQLVNVTLRMRGEVLCFWIEILLSFGFYCSSFPVGCCWPQCCCIVLPFRSPPPFALTDHKHIIAIAVPTMSTPFAPLRAAAIDGRTHNIYYRQHQLEALHQALLDHSSEIRNAIAADTDHTPAEIAIEIHLALSALKASYETLQPSQAHADEYLIAFGKDAPANTVPAGIAYIEPCAHTLLYSVVAPLSAAIAAGNCVIVLVSFLEKQIPPTSSHKKLTTSLHSMSSSKTPSAP